ncbi:MAG: hypothetical protein RJB13_2449 [Pseudomonadota bacterium]|jgi:hypothetical protein
MIRLLSILCFLISSLLHFMTACQKRAFNESETLDVELDEVNLINYDRQKLLSDFRFERITPTGEKIFAASQLWEYQQEANANLYAQPLQSANNISRVFEMAGLTQYSSPLASGLIEAVKRRGGMVIQFPKNSRTAARLLRDHFEGALPVGTLISGCISKECEGELGELPLSVVGHVDNSHVTYLWHNNSYRPENRLWRKHMIPLGWYQAGFPRKWMSTPWLSPSYDAQGNLSDIRIEVPELVELDPSQSVLTAIIVPEILKEIKEFQSVMTDGQGAVMPFRSRSVMHPIQPIELPPAPSISSCNSLKMASSVSLNLRSRPRGELLCQIGQGTQLELVSQEKNWSRVKTVCPDGQRQEGFVLSALVVSGCGK